MTIAIISGNFDVSVSAIFVTAPLFGLRVENLTGNVFLAVATALAVGLLMGAINGFIVAEDRSDEHSAHLNAVLLKVGTTVGGARGEGALIAGI